MNLWGQKVDYGRQLLRGPVTSPPLSILSPVSSLLRVAAGPVTFLKPGALTQGTPGLGAVGHCMAVRQGFPEKS